MYPFEIYLFLTTLCVVKSVVDHEIMCKDDHRDKYNNTIDVLKYCSDKLCLEKCCSPDKMVFVTGVKCVNTQKYIGNKQSFPQLEAQYKSINILSSLNNNKTTKKKIVFVQNFRNINYLPNCTAEQTDIDKYDISEDGSLLWQSANGNGKWEKMDKLKYCIDYKLVAINGTAAVKVVIKPYILDQAKIERIEKFEIVGVLISSFFLLLVLVVYCLLPDLRNLTGLILMAYTLSLLIAFITKLIKFFIEQQPETPTGFCKNISPVVYFAFVSSFFWLSAYAFDVWWGLRSLRIRRNSKHGELGKFMWYSLYAWGTPILLTAIVVTLDNRSDLTKLKPLFKDCLRSGDSLDYYYKLPIGILIFINIVLFCMTVYNIWLVKRAVSKCQDSRRSKQQSSKFATYAKLCLMMGVTWCMELLPAEKELWKYILFNSCNLFTGLTIFYLFVCKKIIVMQLCKKFNIRNNYIKNLELEFARKRNISGITRSTAQSSTVRRSYNDHQPQEMDTLKNCLKDENIL